MQSKQGKRGKALKQVRRPNSARNGNKSKIPKQRESKQRLNAPIATSVVRRNFFGWRFEKAAPHDEFPEGGLRISGLLPGTSASGTIVNDTLNFGVFGTGGLYCVLVNPCGATTSGAATTAQLFSATGPLCTFAQYFRRYRFRVLQGEYAAQISTSSADNKTLTFSYERDPVAALTTVYTQTTAVTAQTVRFPSWTPDVTIPFIQQKTSDRADELWYTTLAGDAYTTGITFDRQTSQGGIVGVTSTTAGADVTFGYMMYRFVIDLYGFTNQTAIGAAFRKEPKPEKPGLTLSDASHDKGDRKEFHDFVELSPRSSRRVEQTPPPSVRVSSRKN